MTDIIYERGVAREAIIWAPFEYNGPFTATQEIERAIVYGLYANTYLHGHNYLVEIETEDLARLVDNYTASIAMITNEEAQTVLEIAAKRYVEQIDQQIHEENLVTGQQKIDALNDEYDARDDALDADRQALITKQAEVQLAWDRATQKIKDLEMRAELEDVAQQLVDVDITEQELRAARADLAVIEAGLKGLDIQLAITQTGIDITNTNLAITNAETEVDEIGIRVSETEVQESGVDLDITNAGIDRLKSVAQGERIKVDTSGVAVRVAEADLQAVEAGAKKYQIDAEISKIDADTSRLGLVDSELTIAQADKRITAAENDLLVQEKALIDSRGRNVVDETVLVETQQTVQETLDAKQIEHESTKSDAEIGMSQAETTFDDNMNALKLVALATDKDLADSIKERKIEDAEDRTELDDIRADSAEDLKDAAIAAAQAMADANIVNTLTHSIGQA